MKKITLADLIRKGLATEEVIEDREIFGAGIVGGEIRANIMGLALIGKVGVTIACRLFEKSLGEEDEDGRANKKIFKELGFKDFIQTENLVVLHYQKTAEEIAQMLEKGQLKI
jgi:hypothetical protein